MDNILNENSPLAPSIKLKPLAKAVIEKIKIIDMINGLFTKSFKNQGNWIVGKLKSTKTTKSDAENNIHKNLAFGWILLYKSSRKVTKMTGMQQIKIKLTGSYNGIILNTAAIVSTKINEIPANLGTGVSWIFCSAE